jgi:hypothetical protein
MSGILHKNFRIFLSLFIILILSSQAAYCATPPFSHEKLVDLQEDGQTPAQAIEENKDSTTSTPPPKEDTSIKEPESLEPRSSGLPDELEKEISKFLNERRFDDPGKIPTELEAPDQIPQGYEPPDADADGISDEVDIDDDNDGIADYLDLDRDGDGLRDSEDPDVRDSDGDGIPDSRDEKNQRKLGASDPSSLGFKPDRNGGGDQIIIDYVFNPALGAMKRKIAFDSIREDYTTYIGDPSLKPIPPTTQALENIFEGEIEVKISPDKPVNIYSVSPSANIIEYSTTPGGIDLQFYKDGADNYYIKSVSSGTFKLKFKTSSESDYYILET